MVRQQIAEDKQRRLERSRVGTTPTKSGSDVDKTIKQTPQSSSVVKSSLVSTCRVQVGVYVCVLYNCTYTIYNWLCLKEGPVGWYMYGYIYTVYNWVCLRRDLLVGTCMVTSTLYITDSV